MKPVRKSWQSVFSALVILAAVHTPAAKAAGGETCAAPTVIPSVPFNDSGSTTGAANDVGFTGCSGFLIQAGPDHIYQFQVHPGNNLTFTLTPGSADYDPSIYIRTQCAQGSGACVARADAGKGGVAETLSVSGLPAGTYFFYVDSLWSADKEGLGDGPYTLSVTGTLGTPAVGANFFTVPPCRVLDTRAAEDGPALAAGVTRTFTITGQCSIPPSAKSISVNVAVVAPTAFGHITVFPGGTAAPLASTINFRAGQVRANNAIVPLGANGTVSAVSGQPAGNTVHFILDVNGYFQ